MILHVLAKLLLLLGLLLILQSLVLEALSLALPNCKEECGGITIPYPFGIGPGCFLEEWYEIDCRSSPAFPVSGVPVLKKANLEVINISLPDLNGRPYEGIINVSYPIISNASCAGNGTESPVSLRGSFFYYIQPTFVAVGCHVHALLITNGNEEYGCRTGYYNNVTQNGSCLKNTSWCDMVNPGISQEFKVEFTGGVEGNCTYALLADSDWWQWQSFEAVLDRKFFPVLFSWLIPANTPLASRINPANLTYIANPAHSYSCDFDITPGAFSCICRRGYGGNPYIGNCEGIGSALGALLLLFLIWRLHKFIKKRKELKLRKKFFKRNGGLLLQQQLNSPDGSLEKGRIFTMKDLAVSTDNFNQSRVLGHGGQGTVYKGMLTDGRIVAIKKSTMVDEGMLEQFINEVVILSQINHRNIVKLLGCCLETEVPLLVYEFIPNGTLFEYLHEANEELPVTWDARLRIAVEIAGALSYLHSAASIPIYHRDIKSTNILLDEKYRAKVADFGTSKSVSLEQTHVTTLVQGTLGYLDPEYFQTSQFTDKSDVYSFGVVLVELLTGQKPISSSRAEEGRSLATYFIISMEENQLFDILHPQVTEQATREEIFRVANLANRCLHLHGRNRPTMKEVAAELEEVRNIKFPSGIMQCQKSNADIKEHADGFGPSRTKPMPEQHLRRQMSSHYYWLRRAGDVLRRSVSMRFNQTQNLFLTFSFPFCFAFRVCTPKEICIFHFLSVITPSIVPYS